MPRASRKPTSDLSKTAEESASAIIAREAADKASNALIRGDGQNPAIIDVLVDRAHSPDATTKEVVMIASFLERLSAQRKMVEDVLGLTMRRAQARGAAQGGLHLHVHGGSSENPEERVARLLNTINGRPSEPKVIDAKVTDVA